MIVDSSTIVYNLRRTYRSTIILSLYISIYLFSALSINAQIWNEHTDTEALLVTTLIADSSRSFCGTWGDGVFFSVDTAQSWNPLNELLTNKFVYALVLHHGFLFAGTEGGGVFRYSFSTGVWEQVNRGIQDKVIFSLTANDSVIVASTWKPVIYRSTDNGDHWQGVSNGLPQKAIYTIIESENCFYAGSGEGVYYSCDYARSWNFFGLKGISVVCIYADTESVWCGTWNRGVCVIEKSLLQWHCSEIISEPVRAFSSEKEGSALFCSYRSGGVYTSVSPTNSWNYIGLYDKNVTALTSVGMILLAGTWGNGFFTYTQKAAYWNSVTSKRGAAEHGLLSKRYRLSQSQRKSIHDSIFVPRPRIIPEHLKGLDQIAVVKIGTCKQGQLQLCLKAANRGMILVTLYSYPGKMVQEKRVFVEPHALVTVSFDTAGFDSGVFIVSITTLVDTKYIVMVHDNQISTHPYSVK